MNEQNGWSISTLKEYLEFKFEAAERALELKADIDTREKEIIRIKLDNLSKLVYIGMGGISLLIIILRFIK